jgi:hypothetical protein
MCDLPAGVSAGRCGSPILLNKAAGKTLESGIQLEGTHDRLRGLSGTCCVLFDCHRILGVCPSCHHPSKHTALLVISTVFSLLLYFFLTLMDIIHCLQYGNCTSIPVLVGCVARMLRGIGAVALIHAMALLPVCRHQKPGLASISRSQYIDQVTVLVTIAVGVVCVEAHWGSHYLCARTC